MDYTARQKYQKNIEAEEKKLERDASALLGQAPMHHFKELSLESLSEIYVTSHAEKVPNSQQSF
jgi:hypothetical protein